MKNFGYIFISMVLLQVFTRNVCGFSSTSTTQSSAIQIPCGFLDSLFSIENGVWGDGCTTCTCVLGFAKCESLTNCDPASNESHSANKLDGTGRRRRRSELDILFE